MFPWVVELLELLGEQLFARAVSGGFDSIAHELAPDKRQRVRDILGAVLPTDESVERIRKELAEQLAKGDTEPPPAGGGA